MTIPSAPLARHRLLVVLLFAGTALNYVDRQVLALLKPTLVATFGWDDVAFGHLGSAFQFTTAAALLLSGWLVDRFGVRRAYGAAVAAWSLAGMAHAVAASVAQFVGARVALAAAESVNTPAAVKAAARHLPLAERSMGLGLINTAPNIGAILTPLLIPPLAVAFGWRAAFVVTGAMGFVWLLAWWPATRWLDHDAPPAPQEPAAPAADAMAADAWRAVLGDRRTWAIGGAKGVTDMVWWFLLFWTPDLFARTFGLAQGQLGAPIALIYAMAALGAVSSGALFPRLLARGLSVNRARKGSMLAYGCLIVPVPLALQATSPWGAALLIGVALFAHQGFSTNLFGLAADMVPVSRVARVVAVGAVCGNLAGMGMIELTGWSLTSGVGYWPMFALSASAYLLATGWIQLLVPVIRVAGEEAGA
jgi:ACS family hexuronate transporter-like MFS transporter